MFLDEIKNQARNFLTRAFAELDRKHFILEERWSIDHLCYRTSTLDKYLSIKESFGKVSQLLIESDVNGRPISTFKLPSPIVFKHWKIDLIEVPAPKVGKTMDDGFEHFEIVCDVSFEEIKKQYSTFQFDETGLSKKINPELQVRFKDFALKFHHNSLESIIGLEMDSSEA